MKKCQFCAEEIQDEAIKCKHCGEMLHQAQSAEPGLALQPAGTPKDPIGVQKTATNPLAGLLSFAGIWAMLYGGSQWFGGHETQASMAAGGAGDFAKPITDHAMSSGLTYAGIGAGLLVLAAMVQAGSQAASPQPQSVPGVSSGASTLSDAKPGEVSPSQRVMYSALGAVLCGPGGWIASMIMRFTDGQALFIGLLGAVFGLWAGHASAPTLAAMERNNPSGFRK